jgi:hypothetical protein
MVSLLSTSRVIVFPVSVFTKICMLTENTTYLISITTLPKACKYYKQSTDAKIPSISYKNHFRPVVNKTFLAVQPRSLKYFHKHTPHARSFFPTNQHQRVDSTADTGDTYHPLDAHAAPS